jgi:hypothetical protein
MLRERKKKGKQEMAKVLLLELAYPRSEVLVLF